MTLFSGGRTRPILNVVAGIGLVTLLACSSGVPAATTTSQTQAPVSAGTAEPAVSEPAEGGDDGDGGGGGDNACLNTIEEVSAAFGVEVTEMENTATPGGGGGACMYFIDKTTFAAAMATSLTTGAVAQTVFDSFAADDSAESVSGIGDEAVWFGDNSVFIVRKGDNVLSMGAGSSVPAAGDDDAIRAILENLARPAADRL